MRRILTAGVGFVLVAALVAWAAEQDGEGKKNPKPQGGSGIHLTFKAIDTNGDGVISKEEWMAVFTKLDSNSDGGLSEAELNQGAGAYPCPGGAARPKKGDGK